MTYITKIICYYSFEEFDRLTPYYEKVEKVEDFLKEIRKQIIGFIKFKNYWDANLILVKRSSDTYEVLNMSDKKMSSEFRNYDSRKVSKKNFKKTIIKLEKEHILKNFREIKRSYEKWQNYLNEFNNKNEEPRK